jgi:hypothetical protein
MEHGMTTGISLGNVETVEDALVYLRERTVVERESLHMLCLQFPDAAGQFLDTVADLGIELEGEPGH